MGGLEWRLPLLCTCTVQVYSHWLLQLYQLGHQAAQTFPRSYSTPTGYLWSTLTGTVLSYSSYTSPKQPQNQQWMSQLLQTFFGILTYHPTANIRQQEVNSWSFSFMTLIELSYPDGLCWIKLKESLLTKTQSIEDSMLVILPVTLLSFRSTAHGLFVPLSSIWLPLGANIVEMPYQNVSVVSMGLCATSASMVSTWAQWITSAKCVRFLDAWLATLPPTVSNATQGFTLQLSTASIRAKDVPKMHQLRSSGLKDVQYAVRTQFVLVAIMTTTLTEQFVSCAVSLLNAWSATITHSATNVWSATSGTWTFVCRVM